MAGELRKPGTHDSSTSAQIVVDPAAVRVDWLLEENGSEQASFWRVFSQQKDHVLYNTYVPQAGSNTLYPRYKGLGQDGVLPRARYVGRWFGTFACTMEVAGWSLRPSQVGTIVHGHPGAMLEKAAIGSTMVCDRRPRWRPVLHTSARWLRR